MNSVEEMIVSEPSSVNQSFNDEVDETQPASAHNYDGYSVEEPVQQQGSLFVPSFIGDDDEIQHEEATEKIPVENEKVIENALIMFAGIFSQKKM